MSAKLSARARRLILAELQAHEGYTMKAIGRRHGVSRQTLSRLRAELLLEGLSGKMPPESKRRAATADDGNAPRSNRIMTDTEISQKLAELERRCDARDRACVDIGERYVTLLDAAAKRQNTPRDQLATIIVARWLRDNTDLLRPAGSPTH